MSLAALAGGSECGPSNPLAQMSKAFGNDRGVQQDHFSNQAGPSNSFRSQQYGNANQQGNSEEMNRFFGSNQNQRPGQLNGTGNGNFDLSPLNRALTPPAWAQAFQQSESNQINLKGSHSRESETFRRAFESPQNIQQSGGEWSGQFESSRMAHGNQNTKLSGERNDHRAREMSGNYGGYQNPVAQARLYGSGFRSNSMENSTGRILDAPGVERYDQAFVTAAQQSQWESAFQAQELIPTSPELAYETIDMTMPDRPASPLLTADQARDALAQTAGRLLHTVSESEQRSFTSETDSTSRADKFANSTFMDLMRKLRDGEVAVEGDKVVEQTAEGRLDKGKGKESVNSGWANEFGREEEGRIGGEMKSDSQGISVGRGSDMDMGRVLNGGMGMGSVGGSSLEAFHRTQMQRKEMSAQWARDAEGYEDMKDIWVEEDATRTRREGNVFGAQGSTSFQGDGGLKEEDITMNGDTNVLGAGPGWEEDFGAETIVGGHSKDKARERGPLSAQEREWDQLQNDWDSFEATATGIKNINSDPQTSSNNTISGYSFSSNNPYFAQTRTHSLHSLPPTQSTYESVLEKEAAVLQNPTDSHAWFALGLKQQENEREEQAILALTRALQLDPDLREAYLALAVSYTNENERSMAYDSIDKWIDCLAVREYTREIDNYRDLLGKMHDDLGISEKHDYLTGMLIRLAQSRSEKNGVDVDADVQIALGVLFNTSEEYDKAGDCFGSALSVRPDDPLLFNRLGATLANGGKAELAIQYYLEAIEIQPSYVRARFNLAVANMNLNQHQVAADHLITALSIQETDSEQRGTDEKNGVTSQALWDSLNIALLMLHRTDLAGLCNTRDLESIKQNFVRME